MRQNRDQLTTLIQFEMAREFKEYLELKFSQADGEFQAVAQDVCSKKNLEEDLAKWDLNKMIAFMVSIVDHPYFKSDFIIEDKFGTTHKIK